jgi:hypothetical protein
MESFEPETSEELMLKTMIRIELDLERVVAGIYSCAGLLMLIAILMLLRLMIGR